MKAPPPYWFRRLVWAPAFVVGTILLLGMLPVWLVLAALASRMVPGRWRPLRVTWFLVVYLVLESITIVGLFLLWLASGCGWKIRSPRFVDLHYGLAGWWLRRVMVSARRTFNVSIAAGDALGDKAGAGPLLVFSRHAGPGDSFLLVDALLNGAGRRPRIILKDMLQLDPCVDIALNRLPCRFIPSSGRAGEEVVQAIADLSAGMSDGDALVLFPEGGNFTPRRRLQAVTRLEGLGKPALAERARGLRYLLPPKPTGVLAATASAPDARVLFVGHVGLEKLSSIGDLWRGIPMDAEVATRTWEADATQVPRGDDGERWLYDQWKLMDDWIGSELEPKIESGPGVAES